MPQKYVHIAIPLPVDSLFTYLVPEHLASSVGVGKRVIVPLGKRTVTGYVVARTADCELDDVKEVLDVLDAEAVLSPTQMELITFASRYYYTPLGESIKAALPPGINRASKLTAAITSQGKAALANNEAAGIPARILDLLQDGKTWQPAVIFKKLKRKPNHAALRQMADKGWIELAPLLAPAKVAAKQERWAIFDPTEQGRENCARLRDGSKVARLYNFLAERKEAPVRELHNRFSPCTYALKRLGDLQIVRVEKRRAWRDPFAAQPIEPDAPPVLTPDQEMAVSEITSRINAAEFSSYVLFGVTGSGKTEVYLRLIAEAIARNRSALCLVPEISLTPLLVQRFRARFGDRLAVLHSGLSEGERFDQWRRIFTAKADIVIGARSAIFAPCPHLGLIVVDEEHDASYKQDEKFCYHARDLALMRGRIEGCPVVLGSATPSLETFYNSDAGKHRRLEMPQRVAGRLLPEVTLVDMRENPDLESNVSPVLLDAIAANLRAGQQALLLLNRRGFANFLICPACGYVFKCANCSVSLTLHQERGRLFCHYCDYQEAIPDFCPVCRGYKIRAIGVGTEKLEAELRERFPAARIVRMDRDTVSGYQSYQEIFSRLYAGETDILLGTQMIAKGHDFPGVTLVGVISADLSLHLPDFRAAEKTFQLLTQVAGRAGRGDVHGRVIIQTYFPEHYALELAAEHNVSDFIDKEMEFRRELNYPPFTRLTQIRVVGTNEYKVAQTAARLVLDGRRLLSRMLLSEHVNLLGPAIPPLARLQGKHRRQIFIKAATVKSLHRLLDALKPEIANAPAGVRVIVDPDPHNIL